MKLLLMKTITDFSPSVTTLMSYLLRFILWSTGFGSIDILMTGFHVCRSKKKKQKQSDTQYVITTENR